jgi:hypothetical protein
MIQNHEFNKLFPRGTKQPSIDAIRNTLKVIELDGLKHVNQQIVKTAVENKAFENGTIEGYMVAAIDEKNSSGAIRKAVQNV